MSIADDTPRKVHWIEFSRDPVDPKWPLYRSWDLGDDKPNTMEVARVSCWNGPDAPCDWAIFGKRRITATDHPGFDAWVTVVEGWDVPNAAQARAEVAAVLAIRGFTGFAVVP